MSALGSCDSRVGIHWAPHTKNDGCDGWLLGLLPGDQHRRLFPPVTSRRVCPHARAEYVRGRHEHFVGREQPVGVQDGRWPLGQRHYLPQTISDATMITALQAAGYVVTKATIPSPPVLVSAKAS